MNGRLMKDDATDGRTVDGSLSGFLRGDRKDFG